MHRIDSDGFEIDKGRRRGMAKGIVLFAAVLFIVFITPSAFADQICSDCHGGGPHGSSCSATDCTSCHAGKVALHPTGTGTPSGCTACHTTTPHPTVGAGTDLAATCVTSSCHGAGGAAHQFTAGQLAPYGAMHTGSIVPSTDCAVCHTAPAHTTHAVNAAHTTVCTTCHAKPGVKPSAETMAACTACHTAPAHTTHAVNIAHTTVCTTCHTTPGVRPSAETMAACLTCHTGINQGVNHHTGACTACHTSPGTQQFTTENASCAGCHTESLASMNHPLSVGTPPTCVTCHTEPGIIPAVAEACGQCHQTPGKTQATFTTNELSVLATNMHNALPRTADFAAAADLVVSRQVNFDASASACVSGICNFTWNFGDGTTATVGTATTTHIYPAGGTYMAVVTVDDAGTKAISPVKGVTATVINTPPTASASVSVNGWTVTIVDNSSDTESSPSDFTVTVGCGSGGTIAPSATQPGGSTFTCTYTTAGSRYISLRVKDQDGATTFFPNQYVYVPTKYTVKGKVTRSNGTTPISGATVYLNDGTRNTNSATTRTDGTFTFSNVIPNIAPGTYKVTATKSGYTFSNPEVSGLVVDGDEIDVNFSSNTP